MKNIVLIGMPAVGKSTVGVLLAKTLGLDFIDTDLIIQRQTGRLLQEIIDESGLDAFLKAEEAAILSVKTAENAVVATGGSAVYSDAAMEHLARRGVIIYLSLPPSEIIPRLTNIKTRGIAMRPGQTVEQVFENRRRLYERFAQIEILCSGKTAEQLVEEISRKIL